MRQGFDCVLLEHRPGELGELRCRLAAWRVPCRCVPFMEPCEGLTLPGPAIAILRLDARRAAAAPGIVRAWRELGAPVLGLCMEHDREAVSLAASLAVDDIALMPLDEDELQRRLERLGGLAGLWLERARRTALLASFLPDAASTRGVRSAPGHHPRLCLIGPASEAQAQVANALPSATLSYLDDPARLDSCLDGIDPDLIVITAPAAIVPTLAAVLAREPAFPAQLLAVHHGPPAIGELPPPVDLVALPAAPEILRIRLLLGVACAEARRHLRRSLGDARVAGAMIDPLTGLLARDALLSYLLLPDDGPPPVLLAFALADPAGLAARLGHAALSRLLAELGQLLARATRAEDLVAHAGDGRFVLAVRAHGPRQLERIRLRVGLELERPTGAGIFPIVSATEPMPLRGGTAEKRLALLLRMLAAPRLAA
jgi:GGDEF domain-containing protein